MNLPNKLTISRIICTPIMILLFLLPIPYGIGIYFALAIYLLANLTDWLDGYIARKYNLVTDFGRFSDQIADKFLTTSALILIVFSGITTKVVSILILLIVVLRDILISGIRMLSASRGKVISADIFGKIKSFVLDVACMISMLYIALEKSCGKNVEFIRIISIIALLAGALLTLISCINYIVNARVVIIESLAGQGEDKKTRKLKGNKNKNDENSSPANDDNIQTSAVKTDKK